MSEACIGPSLVSGSLRSIFLADGPGFSSMDTCRFGFCRMWAFTVGLGQLNKHLEDIALALKDLSVYVRVYYLGLFLGCSFKKRFVPA